MKKRMLIGLIVIFVFFGCASSPKIVDVNKFHGCDTDPIVPIMEYLVAKRQVIYITDGTSFAIVQPAVCDHENNKNYIWSLRSFVLTSGWNIIIERPSTYSVEIRQDCERNMIIFSEIVR